VLGEQRPDRVALRAEPAEVAQVEDALAPTGAGVAQHGAQRVGVGVRAAEDRDPHCATSLGSDRRPGAK
jgi:hypothetical protein